jgi:hypothetical protein
MKVIIVLPTTQQVTLGIDFHVKSVTFKLYFPASLQPQFKCQNAYKIKMPTLKTHLTN